MIGDLIGIVFLVAAIAYWLDAIRSKEIAREAGKKACLKYDLIFLDDTVVIEKVRLRRDGYGRMRIYRQYQFEFTNDGAYRYKGDIYMLGRYVLDVNMQAYHFEA